MEIDLPEGWAVKTLQDVSAGVNAIVDGPFGSHLKNSDFIDDPINGVPVLTTKNLEGNYSNDKVRFISKSKFEQLKRSQVSSGDILVAKIGSIGKIGIYPEGFRTAIIPANLLKFTVSKGENFRYVLYYLKSLGLQNKIRDIATATAQPAFNVTKFRRLPIPIPKRNVQNIIVDKIEELFSELDKGIENLKIAQQQLKVYRQAVLKWAFEGKLTNENVKDGKLPERWEWVKLVTLGELGRGKSKHRPRNEKSLFGGKYPFIQTGEVKAAGHTIKSFSQTYSEKGLAQSKLWPRGTLCITIAANIAETAFLGFDGCFPDSIVGFTANEKLINPRFIFYFFKGNQSRLEAFAPATAQKNINLNTLENLIIPYCSLDVQQQIVQEIESRLSVCDNMEETITDSLQQAEALRQSILKMAFEGKLVRSIKFDVYEQS